MKIRGIIAAAVLTLGMTSMANAQVMVHVDEVTENSEDLTATICSSMNLTERQVDAFQRLDQQMVSDIDELKNTYKVNSSIYLNKLRMLNERYDVAVRNFLTLEQYAIYLNNNRAGQFYDSSYESENVSLEREADGDVYYSDETGTIKICDDKFLVKNDINDTKVKVTDNKIKFVDKEADKKVKITDDKIVIKEDGDKEVIKDDEADYADDLVEIEIDDVASK